MKKWTWWKIAGYFVFIGGLLAWEFRGISDNKDDWPALTEVLKRWVPRWLLTGSIAALAIWLVVHFAM